MTENRRIFWNVVATYSRSLFSLVCGLFTARWVLGALGTVDYGLYGVVGGLVMFIGFLNSSLSSATARYYAISIGEGRTNQDKCAAIENSQHWFNTALSVYLVVPAVLVAVGYPIGSWVVEHFLTIPSDRIGECIWVLRFAVLSCFVGMLNVPFTAMYNAKQYIAELTIYGYVTTSLNVVVLYYMVTHPAIWLVKYAMWTCLMTVVPQIIICIRAIYVFPECRLRLGYLWDWNRIRDIGRFSGWNLLGSLCALLRVQGVNILVNKAFGPRVNAAMSLGNSVNGHASALSSALLGAFLPAITTAYGEGDLERMCQFAFRACKFGCLLFLVFVIPLVVEIDSVLTLWLRTPPSYTGFLCIVMLLINLIDIATQGHVVAINASGRIREYQLSMTKISILTLPLAVIVILLGGGVYGLGMALVGVRVAIAARRVNYAKRLAGLSIMFWIRRVVFPLVIAVIVASGVSSVPVFVCSPGVMRIFIVCALCEVCLGLMAWFFVLMDSEREFLIKKINDFCGRILR